MPLLDHFHPPLTPKRHWESFHSAWAGAIADVLNRDLLPPEYFAEELTGAETRVEIDVATFHDAAPSEGPVAVQRRVWTPPSSALVIRAISRCWCFPARPAPGWLPPSNSSVRPTRTRRIRAAPLSPSAPAISARALA